jgi:putative ABC transport system permease protein
MLRDLAGAWRWLRRNPLFASSVVAILALGIGANTVVFSIVDAVLLRPLPYESADRLVQVVTTTTKNQIALVPAQDFLRWRDRRDLFDKIIPHQRDTVTLTGDGQPDQVIALRTAGALFPLLGVRPLLGRTLFESDDDGKVAVLSDRLWRRRYQADPNVAGRTVTIAGEPHTIAGVMPPEFEFPSSEYEMWLPLRITAASTNFFQVLARRQDGVSLAQVQSAMRVVASQLEQENPKEKAGLQIGVTPWNETPNSKYELTLVFVLGAVGLVLLIACADVGSLLLSRAVQRQKEIAIRASLGAGWWRVMRQLLAESAVLSLLGSVAGIALARVLLGLLTRLLAALPIVLPHLQRVSLNGRVLLFNAALCLALALLCSLAPVLAARRTDIQLVLRGHSGGAPRGARRLFSVLIASEAAFAFLLLAGSGLMVRSLIHLQQEDRGIRPDHVLTLRIPTSTQLKLRRTKEDALRDTARFGEILERVRQVPGIRYAAVVNNLPLSGVNTATVVPGPDGQRLVTSTRCVSPLYFAAMGTPLIAGRVFTDADRDGSQQVAIINEYLARQLFPRRDPIGQILPYPDLNQPPMKVVGIVKDAPQLSYEQPVRGEVYRPYGQAFFALFMASVVVRTSGDPLAVASALRKEVWAVDPNQPVVKVETMNDLIAQSIWRPRFSAWIFSVLGGLAVLLTSAGVYGVVAYTSTLRAREVGIRVALGATPNHVVATILRGAMIPLTIGVAAGIIGAILLARLLTGILYGVAGTDPATYLSACALVLAIGAVASLRPAWRAATGDPLRALNQG